MNLEPYIEYEYFLIEEIDTPEKILLYELLLRAIWDATKPLYMKFQNAKIKLDAREWFESKSRLPFSFLWVCEHLSSEPCEFKTLILNVVFNNKDFKFPNFRVCKIDDKEAKEKAKRQATYRVQRRTKKENLSLSYARNDPRRNRVN